MNRKAFILWTVLGAVSALSGCATGPVEVDTSDSEAKTFDGLYPVTGTRRGTQVWMREDFDLSPYRKIALQGAGINYRPVNDVRTTYPTTSSAREFPIDEKGRAAIQDIFTEEFTKVLGKQSRFEVVEEPGPDVLMVRGALLDVVSRVPPEPLGRNNIYIASVGAATLVIELRDSETAAPLLRAVERREADRNDMMIWSNPVTNLNEVRRLANSWARRLSESLIYLADSQGIGDGG
jgi:hypothetical protein